MHKWLINMLLCLVIITALGICPNRFNVQTVFNYPSVQSDTFLSITFHLNLYAFTALDSADNM